MFLLKLLSVGFASREGMLNHHSVGHFRCCWITSRSLRTGVSMTLCSERKTVCTFNNPEKDHFSGDTSVHPQKERGRKIPIVSQ